jgi:hypothetical protein
MMTLTVGNSGQAGANVTLTTTAFRTSGSGTTSTTYVGPSPAMPFLVAGSGSISFTWTVTAGTVGTGFTISNTLYVTDANGGPALPSHVVSTGNITVVPLGGLTTRLSGSRSSGDLGATAKFVLSVTNTGGTTVTNLTALLWADGPAGVGLPVPASVATLAPGASAAFTWTVTPSDSRPQNVYSTASGSTTGPGGTVPVVSAKVTAIMSGLATHGAREAFLFPSPARDSARIGYEMAEAGTVKIRVYNAAGQLVDSLEEAKGAGVQSTGITTAKFAPGVYFFMLERKYASGKSDKIGPRKFVVTR